ncbi:Gfo/Idh/MocA family protein [Ammoniphilus sp. 3BR4]|uniref:Gfo/Idh/MocA family protein n=1 Tax=Ammoniphilus sp. 3BR4 TaxID=3158265 RepID=UPI0034654A96
MKPIRVAVIGAGDRGNIYGDYALQFPNQLQVVAVAEPDQARRNRFSEKHSLSRDLSFETWNDLFSRPRLCDALIITTQDQQHYEPVMKALAKGYHLLVEKPLSPSLQECEEMISAAEESHSIFMLCYVLRYTPFFQKIKDIIQEGILGEIRHVALDMNVAYWHQAHSYVRGNWRSSQQSSPMIMAKCCHDFDILSYLIKRDCQRLSSFGHLSHFRPDQAPPGSTLRCTDGCAIEPGCPYSALRLYLGDNTGWPVSTISTDSSLEARKKAIEEGPFGRCVYHCDNDVVDHQVVHLEFEDHITATLTMSAFTDELSRTIRILGTKGELEGHMKKNELTVRPFGRPSQSITVAPSAFGQHSGGDFGLIQHFVQQLQGKGLGPSERPHDLLSSHILSWAAEESRLSGRMIEIQDLRRPGQLLKR